MARANVKFLNIFIDNICELVVLNPGKLVDTTGPRKLADQAFLFGAVMWMTYVLNFDDWISKSMTELESANPSQI